MLSFLRKENRFPDFVRYLVQWLKLVCPRLGKVKIAQILIGRWDEKAIPLAEYLKWSPKL